MSFVRKETLQTLRQENADMKTKLEKFGPFIDDATAIHNEIELLVLSDEMPARIAQRAFETVRDENVAQVENNLLNQAIEDNFDELFNRVVDEIEETRGEAIAEQAEKLVQTDPKTAKMVEAAATKFALADAILRIAKMKSEVIREVIASEEKRQLELEKFNLQFIQDGEMSTLDPDLIRHLKHGDVLRLDVKAGPKKICVNRTLDFVWFKQKNDQGWRLTSTNANGLYGNCKVGEPDHEMVGFNKHLPIDRFVKIGTPSMGKDNTKYVWNTVLSDMKLELYLPSGTWGMFFYLEDKKYHKLQVDGCKIVPKDIKFD